MSTEPNASIKILNLLFSYTQGRFVTIKDCVRLLDGSVVPPYTTIPSGQIWAGNPAKYVGDLPETWAELHEARRVARIRPVESMEG